MAGKDLKYYVKKVRRVFKNTFTSKIPVNTPVMYGDLLNGRTALITGGTSGIGFAIAKAFLNNGASVIITGRNEQRIDSACERLKSGESKGEVYGFVLDNRKVSDMKSVFEKMLAELNGKKIDILVNNAGVISKSDFGDMNEDDYDLVLETDLKGPYFLSQVFADYMIKNKIQGNILNVASSSSIRPAVNSYGLAKWGIRGLTLGMAKQLSPYDIVVNGIAPGPTATEMLQSSGEKSISRAKSPSGRYATSEEIANISVILVSSVGRMINGDIIYATGGCGNLTLDDWS